MSRTVAEIYNDIIAEKEGQSALSGLAPQGDTFKQLLNEMNSDSTKAIWRIWAAVVAVAIYTHEVLWDVFKKEVEDIAAAAPAGTPRWYQEQALAFQFGDDLEYIDSKYKYPVIDSDKQIVSRCAVEERPDGVVAIKTAKDDNGAPVPLDSAEIAALQSYCNKIKFAGTRLAVLSLNADVVEVDLEVFYDPIVPLTTVQVDVQNAVDNYLDNLPFNARFRINHFIDAIQPVTGIVDVKLNGATSTPSGQPSIVFDVSIVPASGYFEYSDQVDNMITWTQQVQA